MRLIVATLAVALLANSAQAENNVPGSTLEALGLGTMKANSGSQVRGMSSNAVTGGTSLVSGVLVDGTTNSFIFGSDANVSGASAENAGLQPLTVSSSGQGSSIALSLDVLSVNGQFSGILLGIAGGNSAAAAQ